MKVKSIVAAACAVALSASLMCGLAACNSGSNNNGSSSAVAATVGSKTIPEDDITNYIEGYRANYGYTDDSTFAMILSMYGMTPETFRTSVLNTFINKELVLLAAEEKGLTVDSATIDSYVAQMRANYSSDQAWQEALTNAGYTEQDYRDAIEYSLLYNQLTASFGVAEEPTDDQVMQVAKDNLKYFEGAKKSSHILFALEDKETAESVLAKLKAGEITFEEAAAEYSTDSSGSDGGNVGWDKMTTFVDEYQAGLDALKVGEMSDLVESQYGYHIIKCTEELKSADSYKSLSDLPTDFQDFFKNLAGTSTSSSVFSTWLNGYKGTVDIKINDMPSGLSYDVDMSSSTTVTTTDSTTTTETASTEASSSTSASN